jgi:hypothetical protein
MDGGSPPPIAISESSGVDLPAPVCSEKVDRNSVRFSNNAVVQLESDRPIAPLPAADMHDDLAEFLGEELEEEDDADCRVFPNLQSTLKCVTNRVRPLEVVTKIKKKLTANSGCHFVILLLEPSLSFEGIYALAPSLRFVTKVWGDTPDAIAHDEPVRFWMYNGLTDAFMEQEEHLFSPFTDAISM